MRLNVGTFYLLAIISVPITYNLFLPYGDFPLDYLSVFCAKNTLLSALSDCYQISCCTNNYIYSIYITQIALITV